MDNEQRQPSLNDEQTAVNDLLTSWRQTIIALRGKLVEVTKERDELKAKYEPAK